MKRFLICVMSLLIVVGISGMVIAGPPYVADHAIKSAGAVLYPNPPTGECAEFIKLSVEMESESSLPALFIFDFDVDPSTTPDSNGSLLNMPFKECATGELGGWKGADTHNDRFEFFIELTLRKQPSTSHATICSDCYGSGGACVLKGAECTGCDELGCFIMGDDCQPGDDNCYLMPSDECTNCNEALCYQLAETCSVEETCDRGMLVGEWMASAGVQQPAFSRGRVRVGRDELDILNDSKLCIELPWLYILEEVNAEKNAIGEGFDMNTACTEGIPKFQVTGFHDVGFEDQDDLFGDEYPPFCLQMTDFEPVADFSVIDILTYQNEICNGDFNSEGSVGGSDIDLFKASMGRNAWDRACQDQICTKPDFTNW